MDNSSHQDFNTNQPMMNNLNMNVNYNQNAIPQNYNNSGTVPMMNNGTSPMMSGGLSPQQNLPTADFLIQNDFYREGNFSAFFTSDYILALRNAKSAFIKQKVELFEALTGCETKNRYSVYLRYDNGVNALLFKCKEQSSWCSRNCIAANCRPFEMKVKFMKNAFDTSNDDFSNPNIVFERPFKCTCCCLARPEMIGFNKTFNQKIGRVFEPFKCCDPTFQIFNGADQLKYTIVANCCQCGFFCKKCAETRFEIFSTFSYSENSTPVGSITKKFSGLFKELFTDADNFEIFFPEDATPEDKLMIIGTTLMIDYRLFEDNGQQNNRRRHGLLD